MMCFLIRVSKKTMMPFQMVLSTICKNKTVSHTSELQEGCNNLKVSWEEKSKKTDKKANQSKLAANHVGCNFLGQSLTHLQPMFHFYSPWKHQKAPFSDVSRRYRSGTLVENGLIRLSVQLRKLRLWLCFNQTTIIIIFIINVIIVTIQYYNNIVVLISMLQSDFNRRLCVCTAAW